MKSNKPLLISYLFPLALYLLFGMLMGMGVFNGTTLEHLLFSFLLGTSSLALGKNRWLRLLHLVFSGVLLSFLFLAELSIYHLYESSIDTPTIYILLESNYQETKEFVSSYSDGFFILMVVGYIIALMVQVYLWRRASHFMSVYTMKGKQLWGFLVVFVVSVGGEIVLKERNFTFLTYRAYCDYQDQFKAESQQLSTSTSDSFKGASCSSEKITAVIIIGESSSRNHYSIYGYERNTTPELNKMKDDLVIYNDVISPHCHTRESLTEAFTLANSTGTPALNGSIIQLANEAGFETYWISNQVPIGYFETSVTRLAHAADQEVFINRNHSNETTPLDEELLPHFNKALNDPAPKKLIVIHLLGNHAIYSNRYPAQFNLFQDQPNTLFKHEEAYQTINEYDNSIAYTDNIVANIIQQTRTQSENGFALYFSDHGEDVYETIDNFDHNDLKCTKPMCEIPFVLWASENIKNKCLTDPSRKYMTDDLFHTLAELLEIKSEVIDVTKSVVSSNFIYKDRIIPSGSNYESIKKPDH